MESRAKYCTSTSRKKNFLIKTWAWCRSITSSGRKKKVAPEGFFPVCVGPEKQWFAMKMKYVNHPLFQMLLEDAEIEYGYNTPGPILLPCDVSLFYSVVAEMEAKEVEPRHRCGFGYTLCSPFNPIGSSVIAGGDGKMGKGYGGYEVLKPSKLIKVN